MFVRSTSCFRRFLLSVHTWGRHALSVLQPTCGLHSDQRLISSQGSISLHDNISTKDSAIFPIARCRLLSAPVCGTIGGCQSATPPFFRAAGCLNCYPPQCHKPFRDLCSSPVLS